MDTRLRDGSWGIHPPSTPPVERPCYPTARFPLNPAHKWVFSTCVGIRRDLSAWPRRVGAHSRAPVSAAGRELCRNRGPGRTAVRPYMGMPTHGENTWNWRKASPTQFHRAVAERYPHRPKGIAILEHGRRAWQDWAQTHWRALRREHINALWSDGHRLQPGRLAPIDG